MDVPFVSMYEQLDSALSTLRVSGMKAVEHEDKEDNMDFSVDPLADPRLDKMDLFNMVDSVDRDKIMSANESFVSLGESDSDPTLMPVEESQSDSGSGE